MGECRFLTIDGDSGKPVCGITALNPSARPNGSGEQIHQAFNAPRECIPAQLHKNMMDHCSGNPDRPVSIPPSKVRARR